ncbi:unnamed protein product [Pleuronectes platessa]|uniref:Uncharacterized protein n=1 Tax=Pleuronectes platessa TaxID=8262 RepID=A0A9N7VGZ0_PLEPL|nr:unnamed protein product [Pleuronectes platessa]
MSPFATCRETQEKTLPPLASHPQDRACLPDRHKLILLVSAALILLRNTADQNIDHHRMAEHLQRLNDLLRRQKPLKALSEKHRKRISLYERTCKIEPHLPHEWSFPVSELEQWTSASLGANVRWVSTVMRGRVEVSMGDSGRDGIPKEY